METVFDVLTRREIRDHAGPTRIVLISDLAENSSLYSFYLNNKCLKRPPNVDPRWNTARIEGFIKDRLDELNTKEMTAIVIRVFPEQSPPQMAEWTKYTWTQFFRSYQCSSRMGEIVSKLTFPAGPTSTQRYWTIVQTIEI